MSQLVINILDKALKSKGYKLKKTSEYMWWSPFVSHHKPKLQVNIQTGKWHCWVSNQGGHNLFQLLKQTNANRILFKELSDAVGSTYYTSDKKDKKDIVLNLPKEAKPLWDENESVQKLQALKFIYERGLTDEDILRYNLYYCLSGAYHNRIIIPSYDSDGVLNYFVGRDFYRGGMKYKNPPIPKDIIGFDLYIDWSQPIILCEGVFDAIAIKNNSIPLFGKTILPKLYEKIRKTFVRISSELNLYIFNGRPRPMYSIRHSVAKKRFKETGSLEVVADSLNTSVPILKSNYLNEDEEFVLERHKKTYPELYSTKSKTAKKS